EESHRVRERSERVAELVSERREELVLAPVRLGELRVEPGEIALRALPLGHGSCELQRLLREDFGRAFLLDHLPAQRILLPRAALPLDTGHRSRDLVTMELSGLPSHLRRALLERNENARLRAQHLRDDRLE